MVLTVTYSFNFVTKDQLQLARSVYSCNYTYSVSGAYSISDWQMSKSNSVSILYDITAAISLFT